MQIKRLERFLSLFDQSRKGEESYLLDIEESELAEIEDIAQYLNRAVLDEDMIQKLEYEEDYEEGYETLEKQLEESQKQKETAILNLYKNKMSIAQIAGIFQTTENFVENILINNDIQCDK